VPYSEAPIHGTGNSKSTPNAPRLLQTHRERQRQDIGYRSMADVAMEREDPSCWWVGQWRLMLVVVCFFMWLAIG
jgi:hypothetical protein